MNDWPLTAFIYFLIDNITFPFIYRYESAKKHQNNSMWIMIVFKQNQLCR